MRGRVLPVMVPFIGLLWFAGCDKQKPVAQAPVPAPNRQAKTAPVPAPAATAAVTTPRAPSIPESPKSKLPPNTDPKNVFAVSQIGEPMAVASLSGTQATDKFVLTAADSSKDSRSFQIESVGKSGQPQFVGKGKPNPKFVLPKGFSAIPAWGFSDDGLPMRIECTKTETVLALVPAGDAIIGTDDGEDVSQPSFKVKLDAYYMELLEVTVESYDRFRTEMREKKKSAPVPPAATNASADPKMPALGVVFTAAQGYARWAAMELPTEAEFEKAARGSSGLRTPWGDGKTLWGERALTTVGAYAADCSVYGIFDLAGNAKEWCVDHYSATAHKDAATAAAKEALHGWSGPKSVKDMNLRVVKGNGPDWSAWYREGRDMSRGQSDVGFRCVLRIKAAP